MRYFKQHKEINATPFEITKKKQEKHWKIIGLKMR